MTGYSRVTVQTRAGPLTVSIRSVNRRTLEISSHLPPFLAPYEGQIGRWISERVERGHIHLHIHWPIPRKLAPNLPLLKEIRGAAQAIAEEVKLPFPEAFSLACRGKEGDVVTGEEVEIAEEELKGAVLEALDQLVQMRKEEGAAMASDLTQRIGRLEGLSGQVEERAKGAPERIRARLMERLKGWELEDERFAKEVALHAERADTTEELIRLRHHLSSLKDKLESEERAQGKVCEFIVQEIMREVNTTGAKVQDAKASSAAIAMKGELEKIKEQLANVE